MSFQRTCRNIRLTRSSSFGGPGSARLLTAECQTHSGTWVESTLDLNQLVGNRNGSLELGGRGFGLSCRNIRLNDDHHLLVEAHNGRRSYQPAQIDLAPFIANQNGSLVFRNPLAAARRISFGELEHKRMVGVTVGEMAGIQVA